MSVSTAYTVGPAVSDDDLRAMLELQRQNHRDAVGESDRAANGFVSLRHTVDLLRELNRPWPHTVARLGSEVVGYALVTLPEHRHLLPDLAPMFARLEHTALAGRPAARHRYFVMGQVCVARAHRGRGLVDAMYAEQTRQMRGAFDWSITEVDAANPRSLRAHERSGWIEIERYPDDRGRNWVVIGLCLNP